MDFEYSCNFCGKKKKGGKFLWERETISHLSFNCIKSKIFWTDIEHFISKSIKQRVQLQEKNILICFEVSEMDL